MKMKIIQRIKPIVERFPRLAILYRHTRDNWQRHEQPKNTPMGFKLVGNKSMQSGQFEPTETDIITKIIQQTDMVINIGANIGYYCCIALYNNKQVVAFEPIPLNTHYLLKNIKANGWESRAEVFPLALSDEKGIIEIYGGGTGASLIKGWAGTPESDITLVPSSTLDNVLGDRFDKEECFIIIDIEGAEKRCLDGASIMLSKKPKSIWMVEICIAEHQPEGQVINPHLLPTFEIFWDNGYVALTADTQCREVYPKEIKEIIESGIDTCHTHNFLFILKNQKERFSRILNS